jgi:phytoene synthase
LQAAAAELLARRISGAKLAALEDGWATLLEEEPDQERVADRGTRLFEMATELLGGQDDMMGVAGRLFGREDVRRRGLAAMNYPAEELRQLAGHRFPRRLRPLTGLARLAARDAKQAPNLEPEATPGRAAALLSHRLFGKVV